VGLVAGREFFRFEDRNADLYAPGVIARAREQMHAWLAEEQKKQRLAALPRRH
jgi:hypothetical protein